MGGGQQQAERPSDASEDQHDMDVDDTMIGIGEIQKLGVNAAGRYSPCFLFPPSLLPPSLLPPSHTITYTAPSVCITATQPHRERTR